MEKQYTFHARSDKHRDEQVDKILTKEGYRSHSVKHLYKIEPNVYTLIIVEHEPLFDKTKHGN